MEHTPSRKVERGRSTYALNVLGQTMQQVDAVAIGSSGTGVPLDVTAWPAGNYIIEAIGDEGSHASTTLSVQH